jgi:hypothetical protein
VSSVNIESIGSWVHEGGQLYTRTIDMLEFAPAVVASAVATPTGASPGNGYKSTGPDPAIVAMQKEAADLAGQAQKAYNP